MTDPYPNVYTVDAAGEPTHWVGFFFSDEAVASWTTGHAAKGPFLVETGPLRDLPALGRDPALRRKKVVPPPEPPVGQEEGKEEPEAEQQA